MPVCSPSHSSNATSERVRLLSSAGAKREPRTNEIRARGGAGLRPRPESAAAVEPEGVGAAGDSSAPG
eukprot:4688288-Pyramimonas_sp.AAC.1